MKKPLVATLSLIFMFGLAIAILAITSVYAHWYNWISFFIFHSICCSWALVVLANKKRRFETRIRWSSFIAFVPIFGIISYIFFGRPYKYKTTKNYSIIDFKQKQTKQEQKEIESILTNEIPQFKRSFKTGQNNLNLNLYKNSDVEFLDNGNKLFLSLFKDISNAKNYILLNFYIIKEGRLLDQLTNLLIKKLKQGVRVYIIYDFVGSYDVFLKSKKKLISHGANIVSYAKVHFPFIKWTANYRNHRKDISIDGKIGYVGGINIGDEYINLSKKFGYWNDAHIRITGSAVQGIEKIFVSDYEFYKNSKLPSILEVEKNIGKIHALKENKNSLVRIISSGPNHNEPIHLSVFTNLINSAQKRIWISTPYFIPPQEITSALISAANTGIDVRILIPGMSDKPFLLDETKQWTRDLYKAGVKIYSMNNVFNHSKVYLIDDEISFTGSTNLDFRALFADQQTMVLAYSKELNEQISDKFKWDFEHSFEFDFTPNDEINWFRKIIVKILNIIQPLL
ncbi:Cardiolipin synthetase [Mycoplasma yeatsii 13926]|uniref:Cardiolipin synthase n=1 Tax=Mycoplasma yeatsii 13926 TaxID=1188240 RepID=S6G3U7_9MOLU|nr:cardiolipin synthase [Mycoplasma yeatsii]EOA07182.1 Cardiolipin synthetase [Mycoplasma yeatsii 13926]